MKRILVTAVAALALAGCGDENGNPVSADGTRPNFSVGPSGPKKSIYTSQQPASILSGTSAWEVATRFKASEPGRVVGFRFWRATGETGTNKGKLWTESGVKLTFGTFPHSGRAGWDTVMLAPYAEVRLAANTYYRVSVNTNVWQAKTYNGPPSPIVNSPLTGDFSYYGQPAGSMPTQGSNSWYFADVIFIPDGPLSNLYVASIQRGVNGNGEEAVVITVCNNGQATAAASTTLMDHQTGVFWDVQELATPSLAAGTCVPLAPTVVPGDPGATHFYYARADDPDVLYESNEDDNLRVLE
jgi:hypothetical protein